jgi:antitoxin HicB
MAEAKLSKVEMARRMGTSRSQLDRVLDPSYTAVQLDSLIKAASAVGRDLRISIKRPARL